MTSAESDLQPQSAPPADSHRNMRLAHRRVPVLS
jgi:hypothetical protein